MKADRRKQRSYYQAKRQDRQRALLLNERVDPMYGCLTRNGFMHLLSSTDLTDLWVVYFDLDKFKEHNNAFGKFVMNDRVRACIAPRSYDPLGRADKHSFLGRWFSGDELAGIFPDYADALGYANRVQRALHEYQMSATFIVAPALYKGDAYTTLDFLENVNKAIKDLNRRDLIVKIGA